MKNTKTINKWILNLLSMIKEIKIQDNRGRKSQEKSVDVNSLRIK